MSIIRWQRPETPARSAFDRLNSLREEIDRAFDFPLFELPRATQFLNGWVPAIDVSEDKESVTVRAELPGMKKEDIEVTLHAGVLSLSGERKSEADYKEGETHRTERFYGRFQRSVTLPAPVAADKIKAAYKDGVLTVTLPKTEEAKPKQIEVSVN
jgi:HSP20 family protein